jgi:hypothetical protein
LVARSKKENFQKVNHVEPVPEAAGINTGYYSEGVESLGERHDVGLPSAEKHFCAVLTFMESRSFLAPDRDAIILNQSD